ncbi:hypothetical protein [Pseudotabrizicola sp. 4114]|uniref:hypothetical protein n=1 Tax=Pseudotabrizicola sp. 4114 TaxID=2817731 RepID=UPI00285A5589|nr:hypothetical protein [Pseudorhodobacter sp. 4114]
MGQHCAGAAIRKGRLTGLRNSQHQQDRHQSGNPSAARPGNARSGEFIAPFIALNRAGLAGG